MLPLHNLTPKQLHILGADTHQMSQYAGHTSRHDRAMAGWWLLPSIFMGALLWLWLLAAMITA